MAGLILPAPLSGQPLLERCPPSFHPLCGLVKVATMFERNSLVVFIQIGSVGDPVPWHPSATWLIVNNTVVEGTVSYERGASEEQTYDVELSP